MNNNYKRDGTGAPRARATRLRLVFRESTTERNLDGGSDDEIRLEEEPDTRRTRRRSLSPNNSSSSSDLDTGWGPESNSDWLEPSDCSCSEGDGERHLFPDPKVLTLPPPKHSWFVVKEVLKREIGDFSTPSNFTKRFYGSLHAVQRLELMYKLDKHAGCVNAINFSKDGTRLISGSDDKLVAVWNWAEGRCLCAFDSGHSSNVFQCKFLPMNNDNGHIVTCSRDGNVRLALQTTTGEYETSRNLASHARACHKISVIHQEPYMVISAGADALIYSIDCREKKSKKLTVVKEGDIKIGLYSIHNHPVNANEFCVSGEDFFIRIYDRRFLHRSGETQWKYSPTHIRKPHSVYVTCAVYNYNGTEILGSYNDDDIYLFNTVSGPGSKWVHKYEGHRNAETVKGVNFFGPKSEYIASGSDCGYVYIWDKTSESIVQWKRADEEGVVNCLEAHPKIPVLATSGLDTDVKIWVPSCEKPPAMDGLSKVVKLNRKKRVCRSNASRDSLNDTLVRWWRQIRYLNRRRNSQSVRERQPIFIQIGSLGQYTRNEVLASSASTSNQEDSSSDVSED